MNSSENTLQTLVLIPIAAALVGILLMIGITLLPKPAGINLNAQAVSNETAALQAEEEFSRSGDGLRSFYVARPEGEFESFAL